MFSIDDYHYHLPEQLIAQKPLPERDQSRLLVMDRRTGSLSHRVFHELESFLKPSDVLVINNTQVIPGRIVGKKESGGRIEALILNYASSHENQFDCLLKSSKQTRIGSRLFFSEGVTAQVLERHDDVYRLSFSCEGDFRPVLDRIGQTPLPPYIKRDVTRPDPEDVNAYQTIYASQKGAIAAPTAGFHFTKALLEPSRGKGHYPGADYPACGVWDLFACPGDGYSGASHAFRMVFDPGRDGRRGFACQEGGPTRGGRGDDLGSDAGVRRG